MNISEDYPELQDVFNQTAYKDDRSLLFLHNLVKFVEPTIVLELGTGKGCSAAFMAFPSCWGFGDTEIISIDNYEREDINSVKLVSDNLTKCGVRDRVRLIKGSTFDADILYPYDTNFPEIVFMDSSHIAKNLRKEYTALKGLLPKEHIIVVDDAFANDVFDFVKELDYPFFMGLPYHLGVIVLATDLKYGPLIWQAVGAV